MKRRAFLERMGIVAGVAAIAPKRLIEKAESSPADIAEPQTAKLALWQEELNAALNSKVEEYEWIEVDDHYGVASLSETDYVPYAPAYRVVRKRA